MKKTNKETSKKETSKKEIIKKEILKKDLSPKELQLMECLWSAKKAKSVPKIVKLLSEEAQQEYAESTVRTFLTRIEKKGYVHRFKDGQNYYYEPTVSEMDYRIFLHMEYISKNIKDEEYPVILELLKRGRFSKKEIKTMKKLLNDMEKMKEKEK